jgi:hypothetical protein
VGRRWRDLHLGHHDSARQKGNGQDPALVGKDHYLYSTKLGHKPKSLLATYKEQRLSWQVEVPKAFSVLPCAFHLMSPGRSRGFSLARLKRVSSLTVEAKKADRLQSSAFPFLKTSSSQRRGR